MTTSSTRSSNARLRRLWMCLILAFVVATYALFCSAGRAGNWPAYFSYYDMQAEGFRRGQLNVALVDPNRALDLSVYRGKYFAYWGPVPALLQAAAKSV